MLNKKPKTGIRFIDDKGNVIDIDKMYKELSKKVSNANLVGWVAIAVAIALVIPISMLNISISAINKQDEVIQQHLQIIKEQNEKLKEQDRKLKEQDEDIKELRNELYQLDKEFIDFRARMQTKIDR